MINSEWSIEESSKINLSYRVEIGNREWAMAKPTITPDMKRLYNSDNLKMTKKLF